MTLAQVLITLFGIHADAATLSTLEDAAHTHDADLATVVALAVKESEVGTVHVRHLLCGVQMYEVCAPDSTERRRRRGLCVVRDYAAQANYTARTIGRVRRIPALRSYLTSWVCGPDPVCRAGRGAAYAEQVLGYRAAIRRALSQ